MKQGKHATPRDYRGGCAYEFRGTAFVVTGDGRGREYAVLGEQPTLERARELPAVGANFGRWYYELCGGSRDVADPKLRDVLALRCEWEAAG